MTGSIGPGHRLALVLGVCSCARGAEIDAENEEVAVHEPPSGGGAGGDGGTKAGTTTSTTATTGGSPSGGMGGQEPSTATTTTTATSTATSTATTTATSTATTTASSTTTATSSATSTATATTTATTTASSTASGSGGGPVNGGCMGPMLTGSVLDRWFIDEAPSGTGPAVLEDCAGKPMPLALTYDGWLAFVTKSAHRGLEWSKPGKASRAAAMAKPGDDLVALGPKSWATFELVVEVDGFPAGHPLLELRNAQTRIAVDAGGLQGVAVTWDYDTVVYQTYLFPSVRYVLHVVIDTFQSDTERVRLYVNGLGVDPDTSASSYPFSGKTLALGAGTTVVLGNNADFNASIDGKIYYAAVYDEPLGWLAVSQNASALAGDDDGLP